MKFLIAGIIGIILCCSSCNKPATSLTEPQVAIAWSSMAIYITKNTPANSPTFASRCFGYIGVTMYESVVHGFPDYNSLVGQLNELDTLPLPEKDKLYSWMLSLNAAQASIIKNIYIQTSEINKHRVDSLEEIIYNQFAKRVDADVAERSVKYGRAVAASIFEWSKHDGGHRAYLSNFDKKIKRPSVRGSWEPPLYGQSFSHFPLHPHWGENRTFVKANATLPLPQMIAYDSTGTYFDQHKAVLDKSKNLTQEEKEASLWWGDDPSETFTPPGHSYYLASLILKKKHADMITCAETYARVGMAVADAFINCWKWKYHFWSERPSSYITRNMDDHWESFWPDPPFPAFPSGHATQAAAAATVFIDLFGQQMTFTDSAHVGRKRDDLRNVDFKARSFKSFWQVAEETANSRFYGGIHSPQDNAVGLEQGRKMGEQVNQLKWKNNQPSIVSK